MGAGYCFGSPALFGFYRQRDLASLLLCLSRLGVEEETYSLRFKDFLEFLGDVVIFAIEKSITTVNDGYPAAEAAKHLTKLQADVATAKHQQVLRQFGQLHDTGVGQRADAVEPFDGRRAGMSPSVNENALSV